MNKIFCTSLNPNKVKAVESVFSDFEIIKTISTNEIKQPRTIEETLKLAHNRALSIKEDGLKIGLEAGTFILNDKCYLINFGVLIDELGFVYEAGGTIIPLPDKVKAGIYEKNLELKDAIQAFTSDKDISIHNGTIGLLTSDLVTREDIFIEICKILKGQYLRRKIWKED